MAQQLITIPSGYIWDEQEAQKQLADVLAAVGSAKQAPQAYTPGSRSITDTLRSPQEMAALYPMNAVNENIGRAGATGYKVPGAGGRSLFDLLQAGDEMASGKWAPGSQTAAMQSLTGETPSEINLRNAQTGKIRADMANDAQGGGDLNKNAAAADLMKSIGSPEYDDKAASYVASGAIDLRTLARVEAQKKARTLDKTEMAGVSFAENSYRKLGKLNELYDETTAAKTGKVSADLALAIATMGSGNGALPVELAGRLSDADRAFVAHFGLLGIDLRGLAGDTRFSNFDAEKALRALGKPGVGSKLYKEQLGAVMDDVALKHRTAVKNFNIQGKRVQQVQPLQTREEKTPAYIRASDGKSVKLEGTPEQIQKALDSGVYKKGY